jgi:hypothetical protein
MIGGLGGDAATGPRARKGEDMNETRWAGATLRWILALALLAAAALVGGSAVFSDLGAGELAWERLAVGVAAFCAVPFLVGALIPRRWYLALVVATLPVTFGLIATLVRIPRGASPSQWGFTLVTLVCIPAIALLTGYAGSKAGRTWAGEVG